MTNIWFTADTHFHHYNIIKYSDRPYDTVEEMNEELIKNWNNKIKKNDTVFHLGDFSFKNTKLIKQQLNGNIIHIKGNHDDKKETLIKDLSLMVNINQWQLIHDPNESSARIVICGHVHKQWKTKRTKKGRLLINVGVDVWDYNPVNIIEIKKIVNEK